MMHLQMQSKLSFAVAMLIFCVVSSIFSSEEAENSCSHGIYLKVHSKQLVSSTAKSQHAYLPKRMDISAYQPLLLHPWLLTDHTKLHES